MFQTVDEGSRWTGDGAAMLAVTTLLSTMHTDVCAHDAGHHAIYLDFTLKNLPRRAYHYKLHKTSPSPAKLWPSFRSVWRFNDAPSWRCHGSAA